MKINGDNHMLPVVISVFPSLRKHMYGYLRVKSYLYYDGNLLIHQHSIGEWFNGKTAAFKVADSSTTTLSLITSMNEGLVYYLRS